MNTRLRLIPCAALMAIVAALAAGCVTNTRNDFDPSVDFSKFRTYGYLGGHEIDKIGLLENSLVRKRVETLVSRQLQARGLREVPLDQNPDLTVLYWVGVKEKQQVSTLPTHPTYPAYPGWRGYGAYRGRGVYNPDPYWSGRWGPVYNDVVVTNYREGTLIIDLLDARTKNLVWRTYLVRALSDDPDKNLRGADKDLEKAFRKFPPTEEEKKKKAR